MVIDYLGNQAYHFVALSDYLIAPEIRYCLIFFVNDFKDVLDFAWCFSLNTRPSDECSTSSQFYIEIWDPTKRQLCVPCSDSLSCSRKQNPFLFNQNLIYLISEHILLITFQRIRTYINAYTNSCSWDCVDNHLDLANAGPLMPGRRACSYMQTVGLWNEMVGWSPLERCEEGSSRRIRMPPRVPGCDWVWFECRSTAPFQQ